MSAQDKLVPTGSQTVGPYFRIGLEYLIGSAPDTDPTTAITIHGRVLDRLARPARAGQPPRAAATGRGPARRAADRRRRGRRGARRGAGRRHAEGRHRRQGRRRCREYSPIESARIGRVYLPGHHGLFASWLRGFLDDPFRAVSRTGIARPRRRGAPRPVAGIASWRSCLRRARASSRPPWRPRTTSSTRR